MLSTVIFGAMKCAGIKDNTFSNQLNGMRELSLTTVNAIALNEEISAEWLLRGTGFYASKEENGYGEQKYMCIIHNLQDDQ